MKFAYMVAKSAETSPISSNSFVRVAFKEPLWIDSESLLQVVHRKLNATSRDQGLNNLAGRRRRSCSSRTRSRGSVWSMPLSSDRSVSSQSMGWWGKKGCLVRMGDGKYDKMIIDDYATNLLGPQAVAVEL